MYWFLASCLHHLVYVTLTLFRIFPPLETARSPPHLAHYACTITIGAHLETELVASVVGIKW